MTDTVPHLRVDQLPKLDGATLVLALTGWMDGGHVSTGTVRRLVDLLKARSIAEIDPDPFTIYNMPGPMEVAALFRPEIKVAGGLITSIDMPTNTFYCHEPDNIAFFIGKEPNLGWRAFADCILAFARQADVRRILYVGSFGGSVPHTREPRLHVTCSSPTLFGEMDQYAIRRSGYEGPGSFTSYLLTRARDAQVEMASLVAEIPGYLEGRNPASIEAVTRRLAKILKLPLDLQTLREESTEWETEVSRVIDKDQELTKTVRDLEEAYDNDLLEREKEIEPPVGET